MALSFRPINRFSLRFEGAEHVVRMVFDDIIVDPAPLRTSFGPRLDIDVRHPSLLPRSDSRRDDASAQEIVITDGRQTNCREPLFAA